ncbi:rhomboid family intramembrane serine protease [Bdellovibrionota bacterium FG-2]
MQLRLTKAVKALSIACLAVFVIQQSVDQFMGGNLLGLFALVPSAFAFEGRFWQIFTFSFLHQDVMHLFLNLMMLVFIGSELEAIWGTKKFLKFYSICALSAGLTYLLLQFLFWGGKTLQAPMLGASGAIYGLLIAYGLIFGERVLLFMMLFPMKAKYFIWVLAAVEFMSTLFSGRNGLAGAAHLGGMVAGFGMLWGGAAMSVMKKRRQAQQATAAQVKRKKAASHLKLVVNKDHDKDEDPKTWN